MTNSSDRSYQQIKSAVNSVLSGEARKSPASIPELEMLVAENLAHNAAATTGVVPMTTGGLSETEKQLMQKAVNEWNAESGHDSCKAGGERLAWSSATNRALTDARIQAEIDIRTAKARGLSAEVVRRRYTLSQLQFVDHIIDQVYRSLGSSTATSRTKVRVEPTSEAGFHRDCMEKAIEAARKSRPEDSRPHPKVGAVVVRQNEIVAVSYRGELGDGDHAEFTALEKRLPDVNGGPKVQRRAGEKCSARDGSTLSLLSSF